MNLALVLFLFLFKNGGCTRLSSVNSSAYQTGRGAWSSCIASIAKAVRSPTPCGS
jgi:hypothetical protein